MGREGVWEYGSLEVWEFSSTSLQHLVLSALKKADQADRIVARVFNIGTTEASGAVTIDGSGKLSSADLNEEVQGEVPKTIGAKRIVTLSSGE